jgi:hypothetical protein
MSGSNFTPEQLLETIAQLKTLRSQLQGEMDVLKTQIGEMQDASAEARAALKLVADVNAHHQSSLKSVMPQAEPHAAILSAMSIKHVWLAIIVLFAAIFCHKYLGPLIF